jgi:hypothetical protein
MPSIPKYNQRSTSDLNYAKRRVVRAEKKGISQLRVNMYSPENADKLAENLIRLFEEINVLMFKMLGFFNARTFRFDIDDDRFRKIIAILAVMNKLINRAYQMMKSLVKMTNFVSFENMEQLKKYVEEFRTSYEQSFGAIFPSLVQYLQTIRNAEYLRFDEYINDIDDTITELSDNSNFVDDETDEFAGFDMFDDEDEKNDVDEDDSLVVNESPSRFDEISTSDGSRRSRRSGRSGRSRRSNISDVTDPFMEMTKDNFVSQFDKLLNNILTKSIYLINKFETAYSSYNPSRTEYPSSTEKTYSVGNRRSDELYNSQGLYK